MSLEVKLFESNISPQEIAFDVNLITTYLACLSVGRPIDIDLPLLSGNST